jgi:hypothetical protein
MIQGELCQLSNNGKNCIGKEDAINLVSSSSQHHYGKAALQQR